MHLLDAFRTRFNCVPVVHEVSAGIAAEYFNEVSNMGKALVLVTAGPGLTNLVTAVAGAWLESRELLIIGGQVKSSDLAGNGMRQRGIQEIDGTSIVETITKCRLRVTHPVGRSTVLSLIQESTLNRRGPCFIEVCLDVQGMVLDRNQLESVFETEPIDQPMPTAEQLEIIDDELSRSERPALLLGGGLDRQLTNQISNQIDTCGIPILTTWNGSDRYASDRKLWFGRPDTWGMRHSNIILQNADLIIALGARLGLQQTGFNWKAFAPNSRIIHVDIDESELWKGHPLHAFKLPVDANSVLVHIAAKTVRRPRWVEFCQTVAEMLPLNDRRNSWHQGFVQPYDFAARLSSVCSVDDTVIPCSSGGANTVMMQSFLNKTGQYFFNNRALASMGYGLAGALGAAVARPERRTVLIEGDGGFAQNLQELGTVRVRQPNLKIFLFLNNGYASIRMTQVNYFGGQYLGCDTESGLGFPNWELLSKAFGVYCLELDDHFDSNPEFIKSWNDRSPTMYLVPIHAEQTYFPKISSRVAESGAMESAPLDEMSPDVESSIIEKIRQLTR